MTVEELQKSLNLGGLPMPSIAVIKAERGHSEYGDVSIVFPKEVIDPAMLSENKIYGGDVWSPVYPTIQFKANEKVREAKPYRDYLNDIVKNAVLLNTFSIGKEKSANTLFMHSLYAVADIGKGPEILKLYVEEMNDPNSTDTSKRTYQLQNITRQQLKVQGSPIVSPINQSAVINTVSDLFSFVKQYDSELSDRK